MHKATSKPAWDFVCSSRKTPSWQRRWNHNTFLVTFLLDTSTQKALWIRCLPKGKKSVATPSTYKMRADYTAIPLTRLPSETTQPSALASFASTESLLPQAPVELN